MTDVTLVEGKLSFRFTGVDFAEKYDDWRHYRNVFNSACGSSKAVDFIVSKDNVLWLIEVKDYRRNKRTKPSDLADEVIIKVRDTMAGLVSAKFVAVDDAEARTSKEALSRKTLKVALHLEQPSKPSHLFRMTVNPANILLKLQQKLRFADVHPRIFNIQKFPENLGTVSSI